MTEQPFQEWPKMVAGRAAKDRAEALSFLSHKPDCTVHAQVWSARLEKFVARHPDVEAKCLCGGIPPDPQLLTEAGLNPFNGADPAKFDHDGVNGPGGSKKKAKGKKPRA